MQHHVDQPQMKDLCQQKDLDVFRSVLERVADKWTLIIIGLLEDQELRFTQLLAAIPGISRRMLTRTLRALERDGLVERSVYAEIPPRVVYRSTELGRSLGTPVVALARWVDAHKDDIAERRARFDVEDCDD